VAYLYVMILRFPMITGRIDAKDHADTSEWPRLFNLEWKPLMIVAFGLGYSLGKIPATFLFSSVAVWRRLRLMTIIVIVSFLLMVAFYSLLPLLYVAVGLVVGAMPLSVLYGVVGQYLEGRSRTEVLVSSLGASMMLGAPLSRFLAQLLSEHGVSPDYAPTWLGLAFMPITLLAMLVLDTVPPPTATDAAKRSERNPADMAAAWEFVRTHKLGCLMITLTYMVICAFRNYRDYFASDIYSSALKGDLQSWHFLVLEFPSTIVVFFAISWISREKDNVRALMWISLLVAIGAMLCIVATVLYQRKDVLNGGTGGVVWIMVVIAGTYLMYIPFGFVLQDRLVAVFELGTTAIVLINAIDVFGQLASLGVVLYREYIFGQVVGKDSKGHKRPHAMDYHEFYVTLIYPFCGFIAVVNCFVFLYFFRRGKGHTRSEVLSPGVGGVSFNIQSADPGNDQRPMVLSMPEDKSHRVSSFLRLASAIEEDVAAQGDSSASDGEGGSPRPRRRMPRWSSSSVGAVPPSRRAVGQASGTMYLQCRECPLRFTQPEVYRLHMRNVHLAVPAWCNEPLQLRARIQALAADRRNFNRRLSARARYFNLHMFQRCAQATMDAQPELASLFKEMVPKEVSEHNFWANYANRVKLIVTGFYASSGNRKFRQEFTSDAEYGDYVSRSELLHPGVQVMCREDMADLKVGDVGEFVSTEPMDPPLQVYFKRVGGQRFLHWHQVEVIVDLWNPASESRDQSPQAKSPTRAATAPATPTRAAAAFAPSVAIYE